MLTEAHIIRFEAFVVPEPNTGCFLWAGASNRDGYGHFKVGSKMMTTHRLAWQLQNGEVPKGLQVLHKCDNPPCCNPTHLFLGTQADNVRDMIEKRRGVQKRGLEHGMAKLSDAEVDEIRKDHRPSSVVAKTFGVSSSHVRSIKNGARRRFKQALIEPEDFS